jgi:nicotinamide riboside kinase
VNAALAAIVARARSAAPRCGTTTVIAIDGRAGSGKSTLATALAEALDCPVVRLEQVYPGWDGLAAGVESLVADVLAPLADGRRAAEPHY